MTLNMKPLRVAFAEMRRYGILAEANFLCCMSCGCSAMQEQAEQFPENAQPVGYCFYHGQDADGLAENGRAMLAYGGFGSTDPGAVGRIIVGCLERAGVRCQWSGDPGQRIEFWLRRARPAKRKVAR